MNKENMHRIKQYSPEFITCNYNSKLDKVLLLRACINTIKVNHSSRVWDYNINLLPPFWHFFCKALNIAVAKDMAMHKEAMETKWI
jgi:hypothetical protein